MKSKKLCALCQENKTMSNNEKATCSKDNCLVSSVIMDAIKQKRESNSIFSDAEELALKDVCQMFDYALTHQPPVIISREEWWGLSPDETKGYLNIPSKDLSHYYDTLIIHHAGNRYNNPTMQKIQNMQRRKNYADIAYNFWIDGTWKIYEWRPLNKIQAHTFTDNDHHVGLVGVILLADLDTLNKGLSWPEWFVEQLLGDGIYTKEMLQSVLQLAVYLDDLLEIKSVSGHTEYQKVHWISKVSENCPGDKGDIITLIIKELFARKSALK